MNTEIVPLPRRTMYTEQVAAEVRAVAARKRIAGTQLASALGISPMAMSRRMTGKLPFRIDELELVAQALGVKIGDLLPTMDTHRSLDRVQRVRDDYRPAA